MPRVTGLRGVGRGKVAVELDGAPWRTVPLEAAQLAGLTEGLELDRRAARELRRELRRLEALSAAVSALRHRDHSASSLEQRLERRGVAPLERRRALDTLARAGYVDDSRFAHARAASLAAKGAGDLLIAADLERHGVAGELAAALEALEPECRRAEHIVARRGASAKTFRFLGSKGFTPETIDTLVADRDHGAIE